MDTSLRPRLLNEFVGQERVKDNLLIAMRAALMREEPLDHVLLYGPPGLGKTTLGHIIAQEMNVNIRVTSGPAIERAGDMAAVLTSLGKGDVLFIDEIHRLSRVVEEVLYPAMEDFFLSWMMGKGLAARAMNLRVNPFTLIGATTRYAMISPPLRDRFGSIYRLDFYDNKAMEHIVKRSASILDVDVDDQGIAEIASRSRGTPRVANRLLKRTRDYAQVMADGRITGKVCLEALDMLEIDSLGLDEVDHRLLARAGGEILRRARGPAHPGRFHQRGDRHHHGHLRALPVAAGLPGTHAPGSNGHPPRLRAPGRRVRPRRPQLSTAIALGLRLADAVLSEIHPVELGIKPARLQ